MVSPLSPKSRPPPVPTPVLHFPAAHERKGAWLKLLSEQREEGRGGEATASIALLGSEARAKVGKTLPVSSTGSQLKI